MNKNYTLFAIFSVLFGAIALTHAFVNQPLPEGVTCADGRLASYGFTHKQISLAEFAAIQTWQKETEQKQPGFGQWHQASKRSMKCKRYQNSDHFQCVVSARPCRFKES